MSHIDAALRDLRSLESVARRDTRLAHIDPRAKLVATLAFIVAVVSFGRYAVAALLPFAAYPALLAAMGEVPWRILVRKLAIAAPFAVMVGLFNPLLDTAPQLVLGSIPVSGGWLSFASILLRFALTVSAALVLVATTGLFPICVALGRLGVPWVFTNQLLFLFRYAFVLGGEASRMSTARLLRANGRRLRLSSYGPLVGHLLLRSLERAQRVHRAMVARGFDGRLRSHRQLRWTARDSAFVLGWCAFFVLARAVNLSQWIGEVAGA
jgi:cobalt/nickel transport system permease protein